MADSIPSHRVIRFGEFELDLQTGCLFKRGVKIKLPEQMFAVLSTLLEHPGEVVTRKELQKRLWSDNVVVDFELNLNTIVAKLRQVLGDSAANPRFIETLPKRGYRFLATPSEAAPSWPAAERRLRLIVLPFSNVGGDPAQEYFSDAMTDEFITSLCQVAPESLAVISRTTAMRYKRIEKDVVRIGRELGVEYVVEGGVRRDGDQVSMNVQLIQTSDQAHLFARKYDAKIPDIFNEVNRAAWDVAGRIGICPAQEDKPALLSTGGRPRRKPTEDPAAYNDYIQGRFYRLKSTPEGFALAVQHLKKALARDPEFALAYDELAEVNWYLGYFGFIPPRTAFAHGIALALRALELDNSRAETHALLGQFHKTIEYNWPEVHREMALAQQLNPDSPVVRLRYAVSFLMPHGRLEEAATEIQIALESDPLSLEMHNWLGIVLALAHKWDLTIQEAQQILQLDPSDFWGHFMMGTAYRGKRMFEEAIAAHRKALEISGGVSALAGWLGLTLGLSGNAAEARSLLELLHARAEQGFVPPTSFAWIHLGLAEMDAAFKWLNRAVEECDQFMMPIKSYEFFDPIRADPRFRALLQKMNLEP